MSNLTYSQVQSFAQSAGFSGTSLQLITAIAFAESGGNPTALNCNNPGGSCDRGLVQINNRWHPEVTDTCAFDPACAMQAAYSISNRGTSFNPWTTYTNGAYQKFMQGSGSSTTTTSTSTAGNNAGQSNPLNVPTSLWDWLSNPVRIIKVVGGLMLIGIGLIIMVKPPGQIVSKVMSTIKA